MHEYPPTKFNLITNAFRPTDGFQFVEGLQEKVERLLTQKRYCSALDAVFEVLDMDPANEHAFRMAISVFVSRTSMLEAAEPLTYQYLYDPRLDPIFTVCSRCQRYSWVSDNYLFPFLELNVINQVGLQCYGCGYVVCRECLAKTGTECPNCHQFRLRAPVFPTGRKTKRLRSQLAPIMLAYVLREGPLPPAASYLRSLFETICPDVIRDSPPIYTLPVEIWPEDIDLFAHVRLKHLEREGKMDVDLEPDLSNLEITPVDSQGTRACLVVVRAPDALCQKTLGMMQRQVEQIRQPAAQRLLEPDCLSYALGAVAVAQRAFRLGQRYADAKKFDNVALLISIVQASDVPTARAYFRGEYLESINYLAGKINASLGKITIAHWVFRLEGELHGAHLSYLPASGSGSGVFALDLLGDQERIELGFEPSPREAKPTVDATLGGLLWFNREEISDGGQPSYGRYIYCQLMPLVACDQAASLLAPSLVFDGDVLPVGQSFSFPVFSPQEKAVARAIADEGAEKFFVIALYTKDEYITLLDQMLRESAVLGYRGLTRCRDLSREEFENLTTEISLENTAVLKGREIKIISSFLLSAQELEQMGFDAMEVG